MCVRQYQKGHTTEEIDHLSAKLALATPEQESAETPATKVNTANVATASDQSVTLIAEPTVDVMAECSVTLHSDPRLSPTAKWFRTK